MRIRIAVLLAMLAGPALAAEPAGAPIPLKEFFNPPNIRSPELSPDGTKVAFLTPVQDRMGLAVFDLKTGDARVILRPTDENIAAFFWKGNEHLVFEADFNGNESLFIGSTDLSGRRVRRIAESQKWKDRTVGTTAYIADDLRFDPDHIMVAGAILPNDDHTMAVSASFDLLKVDVASGAKAGIARFEFGDQRLLLDNAGRIRLREHEALGALTWSLRSGDDPAFRDIAHFKIHAFMEDWEPLVFAADNETLYVISREQHNRGALYAYNTRTRTLGLPVFVPPEGEITRPILSYDRSRLLGVSYETDKPHTQWFDPTEAQIYAKLDRTFPGMLVEPVSRSADEQLELLRVHSDCDPGTYYIFDRKAGELMLFKRITNLDPKRMRPMQPVVFQARDGLELHGYLTLPAGAEGKRVPLIIHPHGGPFSFRDSWVYDPEVQFLASRGYAVLQVNYRGSGGYGREFMDKGRYQWGRKMQDDLTDAVHWAVAQGVADPARVAIFGASYGGYAALAGVTLTPDLYCCAINYVGPADLTILGAPDSADYSDYDYQKEWIGPDRAYIEATSPLLLVERIRVPTLHAYGDNDPRVKIKHWHRLESELKEFHKTYESNEEQEQGHGFLRVGPAVKFHAAVEQFLAKYLAPERPTETSRLLKAAGLEK